MRRLYHKCIVLFLSSVLVVSCTKDNLPTIFAPLIKTGKHEGEYRKGVTLYGNIKNEGGYPIKSYGFEYTELTRPGLTIDQYFATAQQVEVNSIDEVGNFSVSLTDLSPGVLYLYRSYVNSGYSTVYGADSNFQTPTTTPPTFGSIEVENISYTSFDISSELLDDGGKELYSMAYIYKEIDENISDDTDINLTQETPDIHTLHVNITPESKVFKESVQNLQSGKTYAIRPYGVADGIGYGEIVRVTTIKTDVTMVSACDTLSASFNSLHLKASILSENKMSPIESVGFCYSTENKEPSIAHIVVPSTFNSDSKSFEATLTQLNSNTSYYIRAYAKNNNGEYFYGEVLNYNAILHEVLEVTTGSAEELTTISAQLYGYVRNNNVPIMESGFCWSMENNMPTVNNSPHQIAYSPENGDFFELNRDGYFMLIMENVNYNTHYYYRAYAKNSKGEVFYGDVMNFTSKDINLPKIVNYSVTKIEEYSAEVMFSYSLDYPYRAEHELEYGVILSDINKDPILEDDNGFSNTIKNNIVKLDANTEGVLFEDSHTFSFELKPDTQYYYRVYVKNDKGIQYGELDSFKTPKRTPSLDDVEYPEIK